jgi:23S rRNA (cytosine1962-C5)-methyltransferase
MKFSTFQPLLEEAISHRRTQGNASRVTGSDPSHESAFRLFNGFSEGFGDLVLDVYARTLVIHNHAVDPVQNIPLIQEVISHVNQVLNWLRAGILKTRNGATQDERRGRMIFGEKPDSKIKEHGVWYAIDLTLNQDASFYLDTHNLRNWLIENLHGKSVLNTFAYTGSFGVAALAGGASRVVQVDRTRRFLDLAKESYALNKFQVNPKEFITQDFFPAVSWIKQSKQLFDCVILDPPIFSSTSKGKVDQEHENARLINKVRPLINDGGYLVAINNALYVSGKEYMRTLDALCEDGYLKIELLIPVPSDCTGFNQVGKPITDPAPFNHSTKIAVLQVSRKHQQA